MQFLFRELLTRYYIECVPRHPTQFNVFDLMRKMLQRRSKTKQAVCLHYLRTPLSLSGRRGKPFVGYDKNALWFEHANPFFESRGNIFKGVYSSKMGYDVKRMIFEREFLDMCMNQRNLNTSTGEFSLSHMQHSKGEVGAHEFACNVWINLLQFQNYSASSS